MSYVEWFITIWEYLKAPATITKWNLEENPSWDFYTCAVQWPFLYLATVPAFLLGGLLFCAILLAEQILQNMLCGDHAVYHGFSHSYGIAKRTDDVEFMFVRLYNLFLHFQQKKMAH
jgi:hypothetical protein